MQICLHLVSPGTMAIATGHSLTPETLKPWVAMVNGSAPYCLIKKNAMTFRDSFVTFLIIAKKSSCKIDTQLCKKNFKH